MPRYILSINGVARTVDADPDMPMLWVLRDLLGLTGCKYGCGTGQCGSCTIHIDGGARRACVVPVANIGTRRITTIEGLGATDHPVIEAWLSERVSQCGFCQPGQIMSAAALLNANSHPTDAEIDAAMAGNLCRCGSYQRIRRAIHRAASLPVESYGSDVDSGGDT